MMQYITMARSLEIDASYVIGRSDFLMKFSHRLASAIKQVGANVWMPLGEVFHLDPDFAMNLRASSILASVGFVIILFPSAAAILG